MAHELQWLGFQMRQASRSGRAETMTMHFTKIRTSVGELSRWVRNQIVANVPAELAPCEFDCPRSECSLDEGIWCERWVSRAAGERMSLASQRESSEDVQSVETKGGLVGTI